MMYTLQAQYLARYPAGMEAPYIILVLIVGIVARCQLAKGFRQKDRRELYQLVAEA